MFHSTPITPRRIAALHEHCADRAQQRDEALLEALEVAVERAADDMNAVDVFNELCGFDADVLAKLMAAYRARHESRENHAHYLWLLDNAFEDAALLAAEGIARRRA
ncbi:hypothetical protein [Burkholderia pseudomallei]|uniref:hypothetical protein n=1 Tax=Burkholderia pseudomallei TaxID=28450 RepID=UPI00052A98D0|nr:hypothetical protein [Burkholderia pseudomallei]AIV67635.1 hypothetical protein X993_5389 [Burkholderia pseudomallei K42]